MNPIVVTRFLMIVFGVVAMDTQGVSGGIALIVLLCLVVYECENGDDE